MRKRLGGSDSSTPIRGALPPRMSSRSRSRSAVIVGSTSRNGRRMVCTSGAASIAAARVLARTICRSRSSSTIASGTPSSTSSSSPCSCGASSTVVNTSRSPRTRMTWDRASTTRSVPVTVRRSTCALVTRHGSTSSTVPPADASTCRPRSTAGRPINSPVGRPTRSPNAGVADTTWPSSADQTTATASPVTTAPCRPGTLNLEPSITLACIVPKGMEHVHSGPGVNPRPDPSAGFGTVSRSA